MMPVLARAGVLINPDNGSQSMAPPEIAPNRSVLVKHFKAIYHAE
jgi:hypothetical protein